ncbi:hypothetical protein ACFLYU_02525 [Candidatus Dependentiae bacterium]
MMTKKEYGFGFLEAIFWFLFIYVLIYSIKKDVNLFVMSFVLLALMSAATMFCPLIRETDAWKKLFKK